MSGVGDADVTKGERDVTGGQRSGRCVEECLVCMPAVMVGGGGDRERGVIGSICRSSQGPFDVNGGGMVEVVLRTSSNAIS